MSHPVRSARPALLGVVLSALAALVFSGLAAPAASGAAPAGSAATGTGTTTAATTAGERKAFVPRTVRAKRALAWAKAALSESTDPAHRPDATLALRRLALLRDALPRAERLEAERLANRPSYDSTDCSSATACIHWTAAEQTIPGWNILVRDTITSVGQAYVAAGYRAPKPDKNKGGTSQIDIYIDDLAPGLYGYCTTDQRIKPPKFDVWAYCVLDNDYAGFPANTPLQNLQVTAAHEFYHAVQFAYDIGEDPWFMEATATWAEDELYDDVNDNVQYLRISPITRSKRSMDKFGGIYHYGVWSFFRYLTERHPAEQGILPKLVLQMWKNADSSKGPRRNRHSTQAIDKALRAQRTSIEESFARFSDATRRTHSEFNEGAANNYPTKKLAGRKALKRKNASKRFNTRLSHLSSATYQFASKSLGSKKFRLRLAIDMAPKSAGSRAVVSTYLTNGKVKVKNVKLSRNGNRSLKVKFGSAQVAAVEVTLVNASTRYRQCFTGTPFSCSGKPVDQNLAAAVVGRVTKG